jgi:hypothetical protein
VTSRFGHHKQLYLPWPGWWQRSIKKLKFADVESSIFHLSVDTEVTMLPSLSGLEQRETQIDKLEKHSKGLELIGGKINHVCYESQRFVVASHPSYLHTCCWRNATPHGRDA